MNRTKTFKRLWLVVVGLVLGSMLLVTVLATFSN